MARTNVTGLDAHQLEFVKLIRQSADRHPLHEVFRDFCEISAIALSNRVDRLNYEKREARYFEIIRRYRPGEVHSFPAMFAEIVNSLSLGFHDCLGELFMALELGNDRSGQFFTPYCLSSLMARLTLGNVHSVIERRGFITVNEPTVGGGAMLIAKAQAMHEQGINYQNHMHAIAQDIDQAAVHMAYIQLALYHVPAIVIHGDTLAVTEWDHWVTPAHVLGRWDRRLWTEAASTDVVELERTAQSDALIFEADQARALVVDQRIEQMSLFA